MSLSKRDQRQVARSGSLISRSTNVEYLGVDNGNIRISLSSKNVDESIDVVKEGYIFNLPVGGEIIEYDITTGTTGSILVNFNEAPVHKFNLSNDLSIGTPQNIKNGMKYMLILEQDEVGGHILSVENEDEYMFDNDGLTTISSGASTVSFVVCESIKEKLFCRIFKDFADAYVEYFGIFNGSSSFITKTSDGSFSESLIFESDVSSTVGGVSLILEINKSLNEFFTVRLAGGPAGFRNFTTSLGDGSNTTNVDDTTYTYATDGEFHKLKVNLSITGTNVVIDNYIDDILINSDSGTYNGVDFTSATIIGGRDTASANYLDGNMKNIKLTLDGDVVIDVPDPSTGVNKGTWGDYTVTDVAQGS